MKTGSLAVWLFDSKIGSFSSAHGQLSFCYEPSWLNDPKAVPLSCALPLQKEPFDDPRTRSFFAGLLPEGHLRDLISKQFHVSAHNDFSLLHAIGGECAGAVRLVPLDALPDANATPNIQWLSDHELVALLHELPRRPMLAGRQGLRLSLAGAQDKLPVVFDGTRIGLPLNDAPSTHILKPAIQSLSHSVINEAFCLALAKHVHLPAVHTHVIDVMSERFLLVERYDRTVNEQGNLVRLHQEDFCQALSIPPEMKYQNEGGPDLSSCFNLLKRVTRPHAPEFLKLLDYVIFNTLVGNHDAHGKNFSLLYSKKLMLAPLYDVLSTAIYPELSDHMAMKLGSKYRFQEVQRRHWEQFSTNVGLSIAQTRKRIVHTATILPLAARQLYDTRRFAQEPVVGKIIALIEQRCKLTIQRLGS